MLLYLYNSKTTDFIFNGEPIRHAYNAEVIRKGSEFYLTFNLLIDDLKEYKSIRRGMIVRAKTPDGNQAFRVVSKKKYGGHVEVEAYHVFFDLANRVVGPVRINNIPLTSGLEIWKSAFKSGYAPFTFGTSMSTQNRTFNTEENEYNFNALDVLIGGKHSIVGTYKAELLINNFDVRLIEKVGKQTNALLYEHKNIADFEDEESDKELVTRIYLRSEYTPERVEGSTETPQPVVIESVVESPLINNYSQVYEAHYTNNDCKTKEELEQWGRYKFTYDKVDLPRRNIKVATNIIDGTVINFGDTLVLKYLLHDVDETIRCVGYKYDPIAEIYIEVELGSTSSTIGDVVSRHVVDTAKNYQNEIQKQIEQVTKIIMSANGYNRTAYGPDPVPNPIKDDTWYKFQFDNPNSVEVFRWDGTKWVLVLDDFTGERVKEAIAAVEEQAATLEREVSTADQKATTALENAGVAQSVAETAKSTADNALSNFSTLNGKVTDTLNDLNDYKTSNDETISKALRDIGTALDNDTSQAMRIKETEDGLEAIGSRVGDNEVAVGKIEASVKGIKESFTQLEIDFNSFGGGVNLLSQSEIIISGGAVIESTGNLMGSIKHSRIDYKEIEENTDYTFSTKTPNYYTRVCFYNNDKTFISGLFFNKIPAISASFKTPIGAKFIRLSTVNDTYSDAFISKGPDEEFWKLEKGKIATPFSKAPLDTLDKASYDLFVGEYERNNSVNSATLKALSQTVNGEGEIEGLVQKVSNVTQTAESILTGLKDYTKTVDSESFATRVAEEKANGVQETLTFLISGKVDAKYVQGEITKSADSFKSEFSRIEGLALSPTDGVNLLDDSAKEISGIRFLQVAVREALKLHIDEEITISFDMKTTIARKILVYPYQNSGISIAFEKYFTVKTPNVYERFSLTTKVKDFTDIPNMSFGEIGFYDVAGPQGIYVKNIKIEVGKIATPWSLSVNDMVNKAIAEGKAYTDSYFKQEPGKITYRVAELEKTVGNDTTGLVFNLNETTKTANYTRDLILKDDGSGKSLANKVNYSIETAELSQKTITELGIMNEYEDTSFLNSIGKATAYNSNLKPYTDGMIVDSVNMSGQTIGAFMESKQMYSFYDYVLSCDLPGSNALNLSTVNAKIKYSDGSWQELGTFTKDTLTNRYYIKFKPTKTLSGQILICGVAAGTPASFRVGRVMLARNSTTRITYLSNAEAIANSARTEVTQLQNSYAIKVLGDSGKLLSQLNLNPKGVYIKGELIKLDGTVSIDQAFINELFVKQMSADSVKAHTLKFADAIGINLDINQINGNRATFIQALFNGVHSKLKVTGDYIDIVTNTGRAYMRLTENGFSFRDAYGQVGYIGQSDAYGKDGGPIEYLRMSAEVGKIIGLGYRGNASNPYFADALSIDGSTGKITVSTPLVANGNESVGWEIRATTVDGYPSAYLKAYGQNSGIAVNTKGVYIVENGTYIHFKTYVDQGLKNVNDWINANVVPYLHTHA